jgi:S-adenosylhomocysteine hydrolase
MILEKIELQDVMNSKLQSSEKSQQIQKIQMPSLRKLKSHVKSKTKMTVSTLASIHVKMKVVLLSTLSS